MTTRQKFVDLAASQVGYTETGNNVTKYWSYFDGSAWQWYNTKKQGAEWCQGFLAWLVCQIIGATKALAFLGCPSPKNNYSAAVPYFWQYLTKKGYKVDKDKGQEGDIIFLNTKSASCGHVGMIERVEGGKYYTIEGNKSNGVRRSWYTFGSSSIYGVCHLPWEQFDDEPDPPTPPSPTPTPGTTTYTVKTRGGSLSLRKAPNLSAEVLANMPNGTKVQVSEIVKGEPCNGTTDWAHVPDYKGANGFCTCSWLVKDVTPPTYAKYKVKTNTGVGLRLRAAPTTASAMLALIPNGTVLTVTATQNGWACTSYGGFTGWACMDYLVKL